MALITYLTRIQFDHGAIRLLPDELKLARIARPLIVTDPGVTKAGLLQRVLDVLPVNMPYAVYDQTPSNPTEASVYAVAERFAEFGADGLIGLGGGSSMDLAKAASVLAGGHPPPLWDYAVVNGGVARITPKVAPMIAIPTTSGTGSEVGRGAVIIFENGRKSAVVSPLAIPKLALCDPELTLDLPAGLTAATGMDAIAHNLETFLAPTINPPAEAIALDGLARGLKWIERAVGDGADRDARWHMMMSSTQGAMSFQKGLGAVHALSHPLGTLGLHHGTLNAVVMPAVLRFNADHVGDKYARVRAACGLRADADLPAFFADLNRRIGLPASLGAMGVTAAKCEALVDHVLADHCAATNPRPMTADDVRTLFRDAMG
jgi:alcohol dehydrogenase class IV